MLKTDIAKRHGQHHKEAIRRDGGTDVIQHDTSDFSCVSSHFIHGMTSSIAGFLLGVHRFLSYDDVAPLKVTRTAERAEGAQTEKAV